MRRGHHPLIFPAGSCWGLAALRHRRERCMQGDGAGRGKRPRWRQHRETAVQDKADELEGRRRRRLAAGFLLRRRLRGGL